MTPRNALVTGASAGIGASYARLFAAEGFNLALVARRADRLSGLADELESRHDVTCHVVAADLADPNAPKEIEATLSARGFAVDVLVNNAGLSGKSRFADTDWSDIAAELQVQVVALTELTHLFVGGMVERRWGRIINLSSLAALQPPGASLLYTGIKSYVLDMSRALDMELRKSGVRVTALCPGFTHSEFHDVMGTRDQADKLPGFLWGDPDEVARAGWDAVSNGRPVCVPGMVNKLLAASVRPLPLAVQYRLGLHGNPFKNS